MISTDKYRVLVTGASGLIGGDALKALHLEGFDVKGLCKTLPSIELPYKTIEGNLVSDTLLKITKAEDFNIVVHCAAYLPKNNSDLAMAGVINRKIDENVIDYAVEKKARLIYLSGTSIYGNSKVEFTEESGIDPQGEYVTAKYASEQSIQGKVQDYVTLRVSAPYGPHQKSRTVLRIFIENALRNEPLRYYGTGAREQDFTAVEDVSKAIVSCIKTPEAKGIFNIASGKPITMKSLARIVKEQVPGTKSIVGASGLADEQEGFQARFSIEKAKTVLGWSPGVSIEQGIAKWINHFTVENRSDK